MKKRKDYVRVTLYLPEEDYKKIDSEAKRKTIPLTALLRIKLGIRG